MFNGLQCDMGTMALLSDSKSRWISAENGTGAKSGGARDLPPTDADGNPTGASRDLGQGWKVHPSDCAETGGTLTLADAVPKTVSDDSRE